MSAPAGVYLRGELLDELAELIERRRMLEADDRAYVDNYLDFPPRGDRPAWIEAEFENLDAQIDRAAAELVAP